MTLRGRNRLSRTSFLVISGAVAAMVAYAGTTNLPDLNEVRGTWALLSPVCTVLLALVLSLFYIRLFRRTMMVPVFFVILALLATVFDGLKLVNFQGPLPLIASDTVMRAMVAAHLFFAFSIFASSLYATDGSFQRHGLIVSLMVGVAISMAWSFPVDAFDLQPNLLYPVGLGHSVPVLVGAFLVIAVVTYVQAGIRNHDNRALVSALGVFLISAGHEVAYYGYSLWVCATGVVAMTVGGVLFAARNYRDEILD